MKNCLLKRLLSKMNSFDYNSMNSDFIWPFLRPYMGVIPNPKMAFIFPISCILALIFPILIKYFPKCVGKGSFPKSQIKSLMKLGHIIKYHNIFKFQNGPYRIMPTGVIALC